MQRWAQVYAIGLMAVVAVLAVCRHGLDLESTPRTPLPQGWLGVVFAVCLAIGALALFSERRLVAGLLVSIAGCAAAAAFWNDNPALIPWTAALLALITLIRRAEAEHNALIARDAIHRRIDEEIVEGPNHSLS